MNLDREEEFIDLYNLEETIELGLGHFKAEKKYFLVKKTSNFDNGDEFSYLSAITKKKKYFRSVGLKAMWMDQLSYISGNVES